jgi:dTDP-glucose 4,6-dehydratase
MGTVNLLELARKHNIRMHFISTDEVYGITYPEDKCYEDYTLCPSSPYSSSKASADMIVLSYYKTFGTKVTISRCTNNFGEY